MPEYTKNRISPSSHICEVFFMMYYLGILFFYYVDVKFLWTLTRYCLSVFSLLILCLPYLTERHILDILSNSCKIYKEMASNEDRLFDFTASYSNSKSVIQDRNPDP